VVFRRTDRTFVLKRVYVVESRKYRAPKREVAVVMPLLTREMGGVAGAAVAEILRSSLWWYWLDDQRVSRD
jgi:hypothetical protein